MSGAPENVRYYYTVYILKCSNDTLYTGIARDLQKRYRAHYAGKGAKYTRMHPPVAILQAWTTSGGRSSATKIELLLKRQSKPGKLRLIDKPKTLKALVVKKYGDTFKIKPCNKIPATP